MRELIERLEGLAEASSMDSKQFCEALKKKAKIGNRVLHLDPYNRFSHTYDTVTGNFFNIPEEEMRINARPDNNRYMFIVEGFSKELGNPPPSGKVRFNTHISFHPLGHEGRVRGKTGTPEKVIEYIAKHLERFSKAEPNRIA